MPVLHVVIPFYNEGGTIEPCVRRVLDATLPDGWSRSIVVVDDHSLDASRKTLDRLATAVGADGHVIAVHRHDRNRGKGAALRTGFDAILAGNPGDDDAVIIQDADLEYDPADYARLLARLADDDVDAVVGSRWGDHHPVRGVVRRLHGWVNRFLTRCSNLMTGLDLTDMECCYKLLPVPLLRVILPRLTEPRYGIEPQMVAVLAAHGARVAVVPVSYDPRSIAEGKKINWRDGVRALWVITRERVRNPRGDDADDKPLLSPGKLVAQLAIFAVGVVLLAWIIVGAVKEGHWDRLAHANPLLVAALLGCTAVSAVLNGLSFWVTVRPIRRIPGWDMQRINLVANMLNYAPIRLGAIARVYYHVRVDRLTILQIGAWFSVIAYVLLLGIGSCLLATLVHFQVDWIWGLLVVGQMVAGILAIRVFGGLPLVARHGRGFDRIVNDRFTLWSVSGLRIADMAMYITRMGIAATLLEISLSLPQIVVLAVVALSVSLVPVARVGFREAAVAMVAGGLSLSGPDIGANLKQLALVESAGEALVYIPLGIGALPWLRRRLRSGATPGDPS